MYMWRQETGLTARRAKRAKVPTAARANRGKEGRIHKEDAGPRGIHTQQGPVPLVLADPDATRGVRAQAFRGAAEPRARAQWRKSWAGVPAPLARIAVMSKPAGRYGILTARAR